MSSDHEQIEPVGRTDFMVGMCALGLGVAAFVLTLSAVGGATLAPLGDVRSPFFFPFFASGLLTLLSVALLVRSKREVHEHRIPMPRPRPRVAVVAGMLLAAGALITVLGFLLTAFSLIIGLSFAFGARRYFTVLCLAVAVPVAIHILFRSVLNVLLPSGVLF